MIDDGDPRRVWLLEQLAPGGPLAAAAKDWPRSGGTLVAIPDVQGPLAESAGGLDNAPALAEVMAAWAADAPFGLVVEDDLAQEGDPDWCAGRPDRRASEREDAAVVSGDVVHWTTVDVVTASEAPPFIHASASGYPTVAFAVPARFLPRMRTKRWDVEFAHELAAAAFAIIVSAFDNEGWIIWHPV